MSTTDALFYLFAAVIVGFSLLVVTLRHLLHSALALIASFFATAGLYILLRAEFVAVTQVFVYIGGVVIFIVFTILLTTHFGERFLPPGRFKAAVSVLLSAGLLWFFYSIFKGVQSGGVGENGEDAGKLAGIGARFLSTGPQGFIIPFEIVSVLLLAAMVGAIVIARREKE